MQSMKLFGMVRAFQDSMEAQNKNDFTTDEFVAYLTDCEWEFRQSNKLDRLIRYAKFRYQASMEQINYRLPRKLDKNAVMRLSDCSWVKKKQNIILTGPTGVGKSFLACALGNQACMYGYRVLYFNAAKLLSSLKLKYADGSYMRELKRIQKQDVLLIDDFGLESLDQRNRLTLLELLEDRHGVHSTIITSQLPVKNWHDVIGDATIADAICDRIIHSSHKMEIDGGSLRRKFAEKLN
jgi:DNA replication protein DnaC